MPTLLVFGARNLGRVVATEFAADGWKVAGVARSEATIRIFEEDVPGAVGVIADAADADDVEQVFRDVGDVDLVVNAITTNPGFGGPIHEAPPDALDAYVGTLLPAIFNVLRVGGRVLVERGRGTLVQVTGGSARRGNPGRGPWAAAAFATRALVQSQAAELRELNVHAALVIVDAVIESEKTAKWLEDEPPERSASMEEVAEAIKYLHGQSPRGWTHELQLTPSLERWFPSPRRKLRLRLGTGAPLRGERARAEPAHSYGGRVGEGRFRADGGASRPRPRQFACSQCGCARTGFRPLCFR